MRNDIIYKEPRTCVVCGKIFVHGNSRALTCSPKCSKINKQKKAKLRLQNYDLKQYYLNRKEKCESMRRPNPFGTFEQFAKWAKMMLKGGVVEKYSKR